MQRRNAPTQRLVPPAKQPASPCEEPSLPAEKTAHQQQKSTQQVCEQLGIAPAHVDSEAAHNQQPPILSTQEEEAYFDDYSLPAQPAQTDSRNSRKRPRDDQPAPEAEPSEGPEAMDIGDDGIAQHICTIPPQRIAQLDKALSRIQTATLDNARQIRTTEQAQKDETPPAGW